MDYVGRNTIYDYISNEDIEDGIHTMTLANGELIDFEIINFTEDKTFDGTDVLGDDTPDTTMLIVKCHKNCVINEDITVTPQVRKKGFVLYCGGDFTNYGTLSMTARGANAEGQELLIYGEESAYDTIPAVGASGGSKVGGASGTYEGTVGDNGINRCTGGGGAGGYYSNKALYSGAGGAGTSYSGGTGGGGCACYDGGSSASDGSSSGGSGGNASCRRTTANNWNASGGIGNPSGMNARRTSSAGVGNTTEYPSNSGTGGLLILYCYSFQNVGVIESNGVDSELIGYSETRCVPGGASGGGSINIFATNLMARGDILANGGTGASGVTKGGNGGNGCITISIQLQVSTDKMVSSGNLISILSKTYKTIRSTLTNASTTLLSRIKTLENQVTSLSSGKVWGDAVSTVDDLPTDPLDNETRLVESDNCIYTYSSNSNSWVKTGTNDIPLATSETDGKMSKEDKTKLDSIMIYTDAEIKEAVATVLESEE